MDIVSTVIIEGLDENETIGGLGLSFHVPLVHGVDNRHVRIVGEGGVWCEPARYVHLNATVERQIRQISAQMVEPRGEDGLLPVWDAFRVEQDSADHFVVKKRQTGEVCWIECRHGRRVPGVLAISDPDGGVAVGIEDFWQSFPSAIEVTGLTGTETRVNRWFWSDQVVMDLRHYGTRDHRPVYEAVNPDPDIYYSTANGIARTCRATLFVLGPDSRHEEIADIAKIISSRPLLVCDPMRYSKTEVFGCYLASVDRSTPARIAIEKELETQLNFFRDQVETWRWYGFWNYGDIMHSFDYQRKVWRYDIGGCAWDNAELGTDLWLCYSFLRKVELIYFVWLRLWFVMFLKWIHTTLESGRGRGQGIMLFIGAAHVKNHGCVVLCQNG